MTEFHTTERLAAEVTRAEPGWPQVEGFTVGEALRIVLNEEWEHRLYAERDRTDRTDLTGPDGELIP